MGIYLNPGNENYLRTLAAKIYVDKTMKIEETNRFIDEGNNYICVSRPRRFGKTIAGNMLAAYYSKGCDSADLFAPYKIAKAPGFGRKLNNFREYTILDAMELAEFIGFTGEEVEMLCAEQGIDYRECRRWYDGYRQHGWEIYNPESVVMSAQYKKFESYWGKTSSYEVISDRIRQNFEGTRDAVLRMLAGESVDVNVTSNRSYNNEDALQSAIYLAYIYALNRYTVIKEMTSGKGFADVVFLPVKEEDPAMVIELKRNDSAESGIAQIKDKIYFDSLAHYQGNLLLVGINYDEKGKTHTCRIERVVK